MQSISFATTLLLKIYCLRTCTIYTAYMVCSVVNACLYACTFEPILNQQLNKILYINNGV